MVFDDGVLLVGLHGIVGCRQINQDGRAVPLLALDDGGSARLFGETVDLAETEPSAFSCTFGGKERIEDARQNLRRDADPAILQFHHDEFAAEAVDLRAAGKPDLANREREKAAVRHGVAGIDAEIQQRKFEFARIDARAAGAILRRRSDLDISTQRAFEHLADMRQQVGKIDDNALQRLPAREGQQVTGQVLAAFDCSRDHAERYGGILVRDGPLQFLGRAADDHQEIVEVVSHAAGKLSDRLHPLGLPQGLLGALA